MGADPDSRPLAFRPNSFVLCVDPRAVRLMGFPFWHPLSAVVLPDLQTLASAKVLRHLLRGGRPVSVAYAGDRMWPTLHAGQAFEIERGPVETAAVGQLVLAVVDGAVDIGRIAQVGEDHVVLSFDADPQGRGSVKRCDLIATVCHQRTSAPLLPGARLGRAWLDVREAVRGPDWPDAGGKESVQRKYDFQAPFYQRSDAVDLSPSLRDRLAAEIPPTGCVLVVGCGTGRECFGLEAAGWRPVGVDFSEGMVARARQVAREREVEITFHVADILTWSQAKASLAGIVFTFDVYSFIPGRQDRIRMLRSMSSWLQPGGAIFLSARLVESNYRRTLLTLQWLAGLRYGAAEWGRSHNRWLHADGTVQRSFVQHFTAGGLRREAREAGLVTGPCREGHAVLKARDSRSPVSG